MTSCFSEQNRYFILLCHTYMQVLDFTDVFLFADDMAKGAPTGEKMQKGVDQISDTCDSYDLTISIKKTEVVDQPPLGKPYKEPTITVKGQRLQVVDKFTYLESPLSRVVHIDDEVNARIAKADYVVVFGIEVESGLKHFYLKTLLQQGISEPKFYGDLVYRFRKIVGKSNFSEQFRKLINRYKRIGYSLDIMRQTACLIVNPIIVDGYASLFNCTTAVRASDSMTASS